METKKLTDKADLFTQIILDTFRFNGSLIAKGDVLTRDIGLTSATWQILGAIDLQDMTMSQIARDKGLTRQSVRRTVKLLESKNFVELKENPDHIKAKLVGLTKKGRIILDEISKIHAEWANRLSEKLDIKELETTLKIIKKLTSEVNKQKRL